MTRSRLTIAALAVAALVSLAACGGGAEEQAPAPGQDENPEAVV